MHILAGFLKNRRIYTPQEGSFRPTLGRTRAMVFNICQHDIEDASFLDLFAGTGAMGFEAISHGAKKAVYIDSNRSAVEAMCKTAQELGVEDKTDILCHEVQDGLAFLEKKKERFHIIFMDPPYFRSKDKGLFQTTEKALFFIDSSELLVDEGTLFVEDSKESPIDQLQFQHLLCASKRRCGDAFLWKFIKKTRP